MRNDYKSQTRFTTKRVDRFCSITGPRCREGKELFAMAYVQTNCRVVANGVRHTFAFVGFPIRRGLYRQRMNRNLENGICGRRGLIMLVIMKL